MPIMSTPLRLVLLTAALTAPLALPAKIIRTVEKVFAVQPGGDLRASTQGGSITIQTADVPEVRILAKQVIRASTEAEADKLLAILTLTLEQSGNDVTAEARYEKRTGGFWFGSWPPVSVSFEVTVPSNYNLNLTTSGSEGDISVASLRGNVRARTGGGDLKFDRIDGEIDAHTSGGDIRLKEVTALAKLGTSGGDIEVERADGPTSVSTSGGNITLNAVAQLTSARTSGGNIRVTLTAPPRQETLLSTSGGDVRVPKDAGFQLDASSSGGDVKASGLTIAIEKGGSGKGRLAGRVNGGGPTLKLHSSGGDIVVRAF
jgi:hypothetical protein